MRLRDCDLYAIALTSNALVQAIIITHVQPAALSDNDLHLCKAATRGDAAERSRALSLGLEIREINRDWSVFLSLVVRFSS